MDSPNWLKNKIATRNLKNNDYKCFQYSIAVVLDHQQIKGHPERILNIKTLLINIIGKK